MKMIISLVAVFGMGIATSIYADEQTPDAVAEASANCFGVRDSGESFEDCIRRVARDAASIEAAAKAKQQRTQLAECFSDCKSSDCMRACIPTSIAVRSPKNVGQTTRDTISTVEAQAPFNKPTLNALDNIEACANALLTPGEEDSEGFWVCVGTGVVQRFLSSIDFKAGTSRISPAHVLFTLHLILDKAEDMQVTIDSVERPASGRVKGAGDGETSPLFLRAPLSVRTFKICKDELGQNRDACENVFAGDPGGLKACLKGTEQELAQCITNRK